MPPRRASHLLLVLAASALGGPAWAAQAQAHVVSRVGDRSVVLHWDANPEAHIAGYQVHRVIGPDGVATNLTRVPLTSRSFADLDVTNGQTYTYVVRAVDRRNEAAATSTPVSATPRSFAGDAEFLEYLQQTAFDYFWYEANPANGLVRDRSTANSPCSIAAVGFGLSGLGVAIDHNWITRAEGRARALATLRTFWEGPQGTNSAGLMGYRGWFYHFLDMNTATRAWRCELSSIDTALLLAGMLDAQQYFTGPEADETAIRELSDAIVGRVDWQWMTHGAASLTMGWHPESGFIASRWIGYNEAMILYLIALGAPTNPLPASAWDAWCSGYIWRTNYGQAYIQFEPLFGHQYSHCWVDFRDRADTYLQAKGTTYFENSRRATLAQRAYAIANPGQFPEYGPLVWGFTACDGPGTSGYHGYSARGAPPPLNDDGTIAPTAAGGSLPFAPELVLPTLRHLYDRFRVQFWTGYGFRDAFNLKTGWWGPDVLGIDQGPILLMAENYRTEGVWRRLARSPILQRGLAKAGFKPLPPLRRASSADRNAGGARRD